MPQHKPTAIVLATFPRVPELPRVQLELVRMIHGSEPRDNIEFIREYLGKSYNEVSEFERWKHGQIILLALRFKDVSIATNVIYDSWIAISPHSLEDDRIVVEGMKTESRIPLHAIEQAGESTLEPISTRKAWIWVLFDLLDVALSVDPIVHLGLPLLVKEEPVRPEHSLRGTRPYITSKAQESMQLLKPDWEERAPHGISKRVDLFKIRPYSPIPTGALYSWNFIVIPGEGLLGWIRLHGEPEGFDVDKVFIGMDTYEFVGGNRKLILWPPGSDYMEASSNADLWVLEEDWDHWLDEHMYPGTPVFEPHIYEALGIRNPMLGPEDALLQMVSVLKT